MPSYNEGQLYEEKIKELLQKRNLLPNNLRGNDAGFIHQDIPYYLEVKNKTAPDYGQKRLVWDEEFGWNWSKQDIVSEMFDNIGVRNLIDPDFIPKRYSLPQNVISQEDKRFDQLHFEQSGIILENINYLYEYYARKECYYIQIEKKGLFFLNNDVADLDVPQFNPQLSLRLRAKTHHSEPAYKYSFFAVLQVRRTNIPSSVYDLEEIAGEFPPIINNNISRGTNINWYS